MKYFKKYEDMDNEFKLFIKEIIDSEEIVFNNDEDYYCPKCLNILNNSYCEQCDKSFNLSKDKQYNKKDNSVTFSSLIFDINDTDVIAYVINIKVHYVYSTTLGLWKYRNIKISNAFHIKENGIFDLFDNEFYSFKSIDKVIKSIKLNSIKASNIFNLLYKQINFIYFDNFNKLKNNDLFKYSYIWNIKDIMLNYTKDLCSYIIYPIYYKQFEYLYKMKLYNLAFNSPYIVENSNSFNKAFKLPKTFYNYMKEKDITYDQLRILQLCKTTNETIIKFTKKLYNRYEYKILLKLAKYTSIEKVYNYFNNKFDDDNIDCYMDYINCSLSIKRNLNKNNLFPKDLEKEYDNVFYEMLLTQDKELDKRISNISMLLSINKYEDDNYIIYPAPNVKSLLDESKQMNNCVKTYCKDISDGKTQIYFMRYKNNINESLVTVEVKNDKVVQAKTKNNNETNKEQNQVLKKFEKYLIPINII